MNHMRRIWPILLSLALTVLLAFTVLAQSNTTGDAAAETEDVVPTAFAAIDLNAGFPLDPLLISLNGGGGIDVSTWDEACNGFVAEAPTVTLNWTGETDFVEAFFYSDHDPVLVVELPDGSYLCNDDANHLLLDPVVQINYPVQGRYNIWVGGYASEQLIPGVLVLTTRPEVNVGTFSMANLITRHSVPEEIVEAHEVNTSKLPHHDAKQEDMATVASVDWESGDDAITHTVVVSGSVPAFDISTPGQICNGFIHTLPDYVVNVADEPLHLRLFYEGDGDATLMVEDPSGNIHCNDDHEAGENLNPVVDLPKPASGLYYVFVGRVMIDKEINGVLTISESVEVSPKTLKGGE